MILLKKHIVKICLVFFLFQGVLYSQETGEEGNDTVFVMQKSPWGAVLRSALLPGLGQIYNESYLKAPIVWGLSAWFVYGWIQSNKQFKDYDDAFLTTLNPNYRTIRDFYRDQRDLFSIYLGITYLLNLIDAYVDAHLFDFTVEENLTTNTPMLNIKFHF